MANNRGFAVVALDSIRRAPNLGGVLRAAHIFDVAMVCFRAGIPLRGQDLDKLPSDTTCASRHMPVLRGDNIFDFMPHGATPVAVELTPDAQPLAEFQHPERAFYVFGPENGSLPLDVLDRCVSKIQIETPIRVSLNIAVAVNIVLYDRHLKRSDNDE